MIAMHLTERGAGPSMNPSKKAIEPGVGTGKYHRTHKKVKPAEIAKPKKAAATDGGNFAELKNFVTHLYKGITPDKPEHGYVFTDDGKKVIDREGLKGQVTFTEDDYKAMNNNTLIHNHPSGNPFSLDDITMASAGKLKAIVAVGMQPYNGKRYMYLMLPPEGEKTFKPSYAEPIDALYNQLHPVIYNKLRKQLLSENIRETGGHTDAEFKYADTMWTKIAAETGIRYYKVALDGK
jgi:hypothetical protein